LADAAGLEQNGEYMDAVKAVFGELECLCQHPSGLSGQVGDLGVEMVRWSDADAQNWRWLEREGGSPAIAALNRSVRIVLGSSAGAFGQCHLRQGAAVAR
jgi:hypothetical protein